MKHLFRNGCSSLVFAALGAGLMTGCATPSPPPEREQWPVMGTVAAVSTPAAYASDLPALRDQALPAFMDIERGFSIFNPASDLSRVNAAAGNGEFVAIAPEAAMVLRVALRLSRDSGGVFDPTIGPLMTAWGFRGGKVRHAPSETELARARASWMDRRDLGPHRFQSGATGAGGHAS